MISQEFEYTAASGLAQALDLIAGGAKPLAGGMSLVPMMKLRLATPEHLVDLGRLPELRYIRQDGDVVRIGAMTTHHAVDSSSVLRFACPLLPRTACHVGDVQVRNLGTVGGSVAHADPAADYPAPLLALEAKVRLVHAGGERTLPISDFFLDTFTTALEPGEIVAEVIVPVEAPGTGTAYAKVSHPASGFAVVGVAVRVRCAGGKISMVRVGVTGVGPMAYRALALEAALLGSDGGNEAIEKAAARAADGVEGNSDLYASGKYRCHLACVHAARALRLAVAEAREN